MIEQLTTTPVILAASASFVLGTAGQVVWRWVFDWRESRAVGLTVAELRCGDKHRRHVMARLTRASPTKSRGPDHAGVHRRGPEVAHGHVAESLAHVLDAVRESDGSGPGSGAGRIAGAYHAKPLITHTRAESTAASPDRVARVFMRPCDQMREFLACEIARARPESGGPVLLRRESEEWRAAYHRWAADRSVDLLPDSIFLHLLGDAAGVSKRRDRLKCPITGRVLKNAHGTPLRGNFYTLCDGASDSPSSSRPDAPKAETTKQRKARLAAEIAERRALADKMPSRTWAEEAAVLRDEMRRAA